MDEPAFYTVDTRAKAAGKVRVSFRHHPEREEEFQAFLTDLSRLYQDQKKFSLLFDTTNLGVLPLRYVTGLGQWITKHRPDAQQFLEKSAVRIEHPGVRVFMKALLLVAPPSAPLEIFESLQGCVDYLGWQK